MSGIPVNGHEVVGLLLSAPSPSDGQEFDSVSVSPGLPGFFATFVLAAAVVLLAVDMTRRVRRVRATARVEQRHLDAEQARERDAAAPDEQGGGETGSGDDGAEPSGSSEGPHGDGEEPPRDSGSPDRDDPPQQ